MESISYSTLEKSNQDKIIVQILTKNQQLKKYFNVKPITKIIKYQQIGKDIIIVDGENIYKKHQFILKKPNVFCNFFTNYNANLLHPIKLYKKIYTVATTDWIFRLVLEKTHAKPTTVDWDNNDQMYIELEYARKPDKNYIKDLKLFIKKFTTVIGGDITSYIIELLNKYINPPNQFKYISDAIEKKYLINRTEYFDIIVNKADYSINIGYSGIDYIIILDSEKNISYYASKISTEDKMIPYECGLCILTAIKTRDVYIIKRVIVDGGVLVTDKKPDQINYRNKKFGEMMNIKYITYAALSYEEIKKYAGQIDKNRDFIEFSKLNLGPVYQWSSKQMPITFYCLKHPEKENTYILYLTTTASDLANSGVELLPFYKQDPDVKLVQFDPSTGINIFLYQSKMNLDKKYVSLAYTNNEWIFIEIVNSADTNKYGDDFKKVETQIWNSYRNPVSYKDLLIDKKKIAESMYFVSTKTDMHEAPIKLNNFVKSSLIREYCISSDVIDLASGRASDLMNYRLSYVKNLLFIEIDKDAIDVAVERKFDMENPNKTKLKIINANLNEPYKKNLATIQTYMGKVPSVCCFFALHYLTSNLKDIQNIAALISNLLVKNGTFLYTAFDDFKVLKLLDKGKWEINENGVKKYSIRLEPGQTQKIELILPFNVNTHYYEENLINDEILDKEFTKQGLFVEKEGNFLDFIDKFKEKKSRFYSRLTEADRTFVGLYKYKVFKNKKL